jgi:chemotaxis protein histidine kinase CheA
LPASGVSVLPVHHALIARVGDITCAIPVEHVVEIMRPLPVEHGAAIIRGVATSVLDTARVLAQEASASARFVVVRTSNENWALVFDEVRGVEAVMIGELATLVPEIDPVMLATLAPELVAVLATACVIP